MKKLLLAVAVSTIAVGSVNAATIYEKDGFTYKLNGDFQVQLRQEIGADENLGVDFDDLELKNYVSYDLGNDMKAFGRVDFGFKDVANKSAKDEGDEDVALEEAYLGIQYGVASFSFGKQNFASDEFGVEKAYELTQKEDRFDQTGTDGDDTLRVDVELDNVYLVASYEMEAEGTDSEGDEYFDLFASTKIAELTLAAAYQQKTPIGGDSLDTYGVSAVYNFGIAELGVDYSTTDDQADQLNVAAVFGVASTTDIAIGVVDVDWEEEVGKADVTEWYANVTYKFPTAKNVSVFAEIADNDLDESDLGYLAGMRVKF